MTFRTWLLAAALLLCSADAVPADDMPFGADALSQLVDEARVIVVAGKARALPTDKALARDPRRVAMHAFAVQVAEVLNGPADKGSELRVGIIEGSDTPRAKEIANAILFLQPLAAEALAKTNIIGKGPAYIVVSGDYGIVASDVPGRKEAVRSYVEAAGARKLATEEVLQWARRHLASPDPFLQRSAVVDLHFANRDPAAVKQLGEALLSDAVLPETKRSAIVALERASGPDAAAHLKAFAENQAMHKGLRAAAVKAFRSLPGGDDQLRQWSATTDSILAPAAQSILRGREGPPKR